MQGGDTDLSCLMVSMRVVTVVVDVTAEVSFMRRCAACALRVPRDTASCILSVSPVDGSVTCQYHRVSNVSKYFRIYLYLFYLYIALINCNDVLY